MLPCSDTYRQRSPPRLLFPIRVFRPLKDVSGHFITIFHSFTLPVPLRAMLVPVVAATFIISALAGVSSAQSPAYNGICEQISGSISAGSGVYYKPDRLYRKGIEHFMTSSEQESSCVVEPGNTDDLGKIITILGSTRTPFAVKGGGHCSNPNGSSTEGVQIAMYRFSDVNYNANAQTVEIGTGLIWDDVYNVLIPQGVNVVGGRTSGVGVAGFTLGGGYSWLTNQYGLTVDTVVSFELVKTDGTVVTVTDSSDSDLFWALKGGLNNFGIVTKITLKTFPQGQVWGGLVIYTSNKLDEVATAVTNFAANVNDPKASIITAVNFLLTQTLVTQLIFYDGPNPPDGIFDEFLDITSLSKDVKSRDFISLFKSSPVNLTANQRGLFQNIPVVNLTANVINAMFNETKVKSTHPLFGNDLTSYLSLCSTGVTNSITTPATFISYQLEPFLPSILSHSSSASAWPPTRDVAYLPLNIDYGWLLESQDEVLRDAARQSAAHITQVALDEGQQVENAPHYVNYALYDTPIEKIYGASLDKMRSVKARVDPDDVMGLTGGFKF
ncbi:hypothetical protein D9758_013012 [Tetrapyrgos nigripes]|uniref:FAD-binding PCMH-type domain-containing protein n=1 Tax=Tetrapyrgos nigripes TaxID=182062 RepID=A0A8H5C9L6_9AGAR|nr:hypothetical protein D9758_013012 [Tetrapyrgos nigripes]